MVHLMKGLHILDLHILKYIYCVEQSQWIANANWSALSVAEIANCGASCCSCVSSHKKIGPFCSFSVGAASKFALENILECSCDCACIFFRHYCWSWLEIVCTFFLGPFSGFSDGSWSLAFEAGFRRMLELCVLLSRCVSCGRCLVFVCFHAIMHDFRLN